jgi:hypothetical protein
LKKLLLLLILPWALWAMDDASTLKLYSRIISELASPKAKVFVDSEELAEVLKKSFEIVSEPVQADIAIVTSEKEAKKLAGKIATMPCKPVVFATSYRLMKDYDFIVGALFWKKGRAQLLFIKKRLERCELDLSKDLRRYTVDEL